VGTGVALIQRRKQLVFPLFPQDYLASKHFPSNTHAPLRASTQATCVLAMPMR
jgi:hypothetical protein